MTTVGLTDTRQETRMSRHFHRISRADVTAMAATRAFMETVPKLSISPASRPQFDEMIQQTPPAEGVTYDAGHIGGIPGYWCRPTGEPGNSAILYLHGGGYVIGSASAYRHPVGHIAAAARISAFALDYALAPERPFPAAIGDALAAYGDLVDRGYTRIALAGDSAGGGLALALAALVSGRQRTSPKAVVAVSPWTDLTVSGLSVDARASADPLLDRQQLLDTAAVYLDGTDPSDPRASPLFGDVSRVPAIQIHVGEDEVLLDDSVRYAKRVDDNGGSAELHVWEGMLHVFTSSVATLEAARHATGMMGAFLAAHLAEPGLSG